MNSVRRSFRDAIVGLSLVGGIILFAGSLLWLRGVRLGSKAWVLNANFSDASGLSEGSPVTYRGILIGSVGEITVKPETVQAILNIDNADLLLAKPVIAKLVKNSLLGGDVKITLISQGALLPEDSARPIEQGCISQKMLCAGDTIKGQPLTSISTLTTEIERLVRKAGEKDIIDNLVSSAEQFDKTQKELENLILQAKLEMNRAAPIISEITKATIHINNILSAIDNPDTLNNITETAENARSLSEKIDIIGGDINEIMGDEELMSAIRSVTIGLGKFFEEVYPPKSK